MVIVAELELPIAYTEGLEDRVKMAVSGLAPVLLALAVMGSVAEEAPAGIVSDTGMSPCGIRQ
jgi:hypothetical protein